MKKLLILLILAFPMMSLAREQCRMAFELELLQPKVFSKGLKVFTSTANRQIVFDYVRPAKGKNTLVLLHGLGDSMYHLEAMADLAIRSGMGVLRVDLHGHGRTLSEFVKRHGDIPAELNFRDNIEDVRDLIKYLNLKQVSILGHSYGGGIAFGLAVELQNVRGIVVRSLHMLAPYVQRIDKFFSDYVKSPQFLVNNAGKVLESSGVSSGTVNTIMGPLFFMASQLAMNVQFLQSSVRRALLLDQTKDIFLDPWMDGFMRMTYREYFLITEHKKGKVLSDTEREDINLKVEAAIKATKGIRGFDLLDRALGLPKKLPPLQIIGGKADQLVVEEQLKDFAFRLDHDHLPYELVMLDSDRASHLFPRTMPDQVFGKVKEFMDAGAGPQRPGK